MSVLEKICTAMTELEENCSAMAVLEENCTLCQNQNYSAIAVL